VTLPGFLDDCKVTAAEKGSRYTDTKWRLGSLAFILLLVNSWAQVRRQCSSAKAAFKHQLHSDHTAARRWLESSREWLGAETMEARKDGGSTKKPSSVEEFQSASRS
jgi:hypothetical protein